MASHSEAAWLLWQQVKKTSPLVQCLTNDVAQDITANVLLAAGASPAMVASSDECEAFAQHCASALLVNLGTLSSAAVASQRLAIQAALANGKPVVLDPVACGATPYRTNACVAALELRPTVVRGNAGEVLSLAKAAGAWEEEIRGAGGGTDDDKPLVRGVDSAVGTGDRRVLQAARAIAEIYGCVVGVSGAVDLVVAPSAGDGSSSGLVLAVRNGVEMLTRVTAAGCSLTALIAAFVAAAGADDAKEVALATAAALAAFGVAAELSLERAQHKGPGSLRVGLLDALYLMTEDEFKKRAKIERMG
jgi:hydroxyethylthiazole kinase